MIACSLTNVKDEKTLLDILDTLASHHGVRVRYLQPCLPRKYDICIEGVDETLCHSDLERFAAKRGWQVKQSPVGMFLNLAI